MEQMKQERDYTLAVATTRPSISDDYSDCMWSIILGAICVFNAILMYINIQDGSKWLAYLCLGSLVVNFASLFYRMRTNRYAGAIQAYKSLS